MCCRCRWVLGLPSHLEDRAVPSHGLPWVGLVGGGGEAQLGQSLGLGLGAGMALFTFVEDQGDALSLERVRPVLCLAWEGPDAVAEVQWVVRCDVQESARVLAEPEDRVPPLCQRVPMRWAYRVHVDLQR